jgi:hypothetical protein
MKYGIKDCKSILRIWVMKIAFNEIGVTIR